MVVSSKAVALPERVSFARIPDIRPMPGLIQIQLDFLSGLRKKVSTNFLQRFLLLKTLLVKI